MANISPQNIVKGIIQIIRPVHWVKNLSVFAALIFSQNLFDPLLFSKVVWAFVAFCLSASATYIFNDITDADRDRLHPIKRYRPIASGKLPIPIAVVLAIGLVLISLILAKSLSYIFYVLILVYLLLQAFYSLVLKNLPVIDIIVIATGFIIRVYAGAFVIDAHLSVWFLLCVISVALFLASGKRRAELGALGSAAGTRESLSKYPPELLNSYVTMFGNAAWMSWALFTFFESPRVSTPLWILLAEISKAAAINKLLMVTIPFTIFGIMRYQSLIFENRSEAPEKILLTDIPLVASVAIWITLVIFILYTGISI
ncbi:MAG: decaprenyl-phosphate phosphoribosyltransferase [Patescibacteria group bacterium]|mgnify:CR=1 FL=1